MKYTLQIENSTNKLSFILEFFKRISFVKKVKVIESNEIVNPKISQTIEDYESGKVSPTPLNLKELKAMINA